MGTIQTVKSTIGYGSDPAGRPPDDFYRTPEKATLALLDWESFKGPILEPACGDGAISTVLEEWGYDVISQDLYDYGYGKIGKDFLDETKNVSAVVTNPPFKLAEPFIKKGLELTENKHGKLALLLRLSFLEGQRRKLLFQTSPLKRVLVFSKRLTFTRPQDEGKVQSGMMAYAWYVWDWEYYGEPQIGWI